MSKGLGLMFNTGGVISFICLLCLTFQISGIYVKNIRHTVITSQDIKVAICADQVKVFFMEYFNAFIYTHLRYILYSQWLIIDILFIVIQFNRMNANLPDSYHLLRMFVYILK